MRLKLVLVRERNPAYRVRESIASPREAALRLGPVIANEAQEVFMAVVVDGRNRYSGHYEVSRGSLTSSMIHPREVFKQAILRNASALFLFHNHPSGDPAPSDEDIAVTKRLVRAGELLGIPILDHIILSQGCAYTSLREAGFL